LKKKTTRTIEISIKTDERLVIKHRRSVTRVWCAQCGEETSVTLIEDPNRSASELRAEGEQPHFIETAGGSFICLGSVSGEESEE